MGYKIYICVCKILPDNLKNLVIYHQRIEYIQGSDYLANKYATRIQKNWKRYKSNKVTRKFQDLITQISHYPTLDTHDKRGYQTKKIFSSRWE